MNGRQAPHMTNDVQSPENTMGVVVPFPGVTLGAHDALGHSADIQNDHLAQLGTQFSEIDDSLREKGLDTTDADLANALEQKLDLAARVVSTDDCLPEEAVDVLIENRDRALFTMIHARQTLSFATEQDETDWVKENVAPVFATQISERAAAIAAAPAESHNTPPTTETVEEHESIVTQVRQRTSARWAELKDRFKRNPEDGKNKHVQRLAKLSSGTGMLATSSWLQDRLQSRRKTTDTGLGAGALLVGHAKKLGSGVKKTAKPVIESLYDKPLRQVDVFLRNTVVPGAVGAVKNARENKRFSLRNEDDKIRKGVKVALGVGGTAVAALLIYKNLNGLHDLAQNILPDGGSKGGHTSTGSPRAGNKGLGSSISEHLPSNGINKSTNNLTEHVTDRQAIEALDTKLGMPEHLSPDVKQNLRQAALDIAKDHSVDIGSDEFNDIVNSSFELSTIHDAQEAIQIAHPDVVQGTPAYTELIDNVFSLANEARQYKPGNSGLSFDEQFSRYWTERNNFIQARGIPQRQFDQQFIAFIEHMKQLQEAEDLLEAAS